VAAIPPNNSIRPSVLFIKRLDDLLKLCLLFPFLPTIIVRVPALSNLFRGGSSGSRLGLGVLEGRGNRCSGSLLCFLASFSLINREMHLANNARRCVGLLFALFSYFWLGHGP
jgi:hypothetical protein